MGRGILPIKVATEASMMPSCGLRSKSAAGFKSSKGQRLLVLPAKARKSGMEGPPVLLTACVQSHGDVTIVSSPKLGIVYDCNN